MHVQAISALLVLGSQSWIAYALLALVLVYVLVLSLSPSRAKAMQAVASELKLHFEPIRSRKEIGIQGTTFDLGFPAENSISGVIAGRDTIIFDKTMPIEPRHRAGTDAMTCERTIVGFRVAPNAFCQNRAINSPGEWHVEKMGEWVFVYGDSGLVKPKNIIAYVEEARGWFEKATHPPQDR